MAAILSKLKSKGKVAHFRFFTTLSSNNHRCNKSGFLSPFSAPAFSSSSSASSSSSSASAFKPASKISEEKWRWSGLLLYIPGAFAFGLGTWQFSRRQEKIELLEHRRQRLQQDPISLGDFLSEDKSKRDLSSLEFRRVVCEGVYDESKSIFVGPRSRVVAGVTKNGYFLVTPLLLVAENKSLQHSVLVNRGWVPQSWRDNFFQQSREATLEQKLLPCDEKTENISWWKFWSKRSNRSEEKEDTRASCNTVRVVGVIRGSENPSAFVPFNDPESGQWFFVDVPAMCEAAGLSKNTVYLEEVDGEHTASNPYPVPKEERTFLNFSVMPQDHLNYILTWYTLSAATIYMATKRLKMK